MSGAGAGGTAPGANKGAACCAPVPAPERPRRSGCAVTRFAVPNGAGQIVHVAHTFRGADAVVHTLARSGIKKVFTLSGNHIMPLFDAALDAGVEMIHTRHEAAAVHMADAWARLTGEPGIAMVTGGPGHANAVSALFTAQMSESAVVLLSGHAPSDQLGCGAFQEMRQAEMAAPLTKAAWTSNDPSALGRDVTRAMTIAQAGRPGPVQLNVPVDMLTATVRGDTVPATETCQPQAMSLAAGDARAMLDRLSAAARPLVLAGPASMTTAGRARLRALEAATDIPVVGIQSARGVRAPSVGVLAEVIARA